MDTLTLVIIVSLPLVWLIFGSWLLFNWIRYSWIHRNNSRNINGAQLTREILDISGMRDTRITKSIWYMKYWNHNKKRNTYRLRNWTYNRKSIWTMTEAAQQAYVTTQRNIDKRQFYLFRLPFVLSLIGTLVFIGGIYLLKRYPLGSNEIKVNSILAIIIILTGSIISTIGIVIMRFIIYKKVLPFLNQIGFNEFEKRAFKQIYLSFFLYSIVLIIINLIQLILRIFGLDSRRKD